MDSEPYHASQVLVNQETKEFIVRVWGKTFRKGTVSSIADLQDICKSALGPGAASCPGHYSDSLGHLFEHMPSFTQLTHPFKRYKDIDAMLGGRLSRRFCSVLSGSTPCLDAN